jgi:predicted permease
MFGLSLSPPGADVLVMTPHLSAASASAYAAASAFSRGALIVGQLLLLSYLPVLYREGRSEFIRKGRHAVLVAAGLSAVGSMGSPLILSKLADKQIVSGAAFLAGFICVACGAYVNMVSYSMLSSRENLRASMLVAWSGVLLVVAVSFILRPVTVEAASVTLAAAAVASALLAAGVSRKAS